MMLRPKAFYLFYYGAMASLIPFLVIYYEHHGLSGRQIGLLTAIPPLVTLFAAPLWGAAADATWRHKAALVTAIPGTMLAVLLLSRQTAFGSLIPTVVFYAFFLAPILPLVDNAVMALLDKRQDEYGKQRLWGAVGWGLAAPLAGWLIVRAGLGWAFYGFLILMSGAFLVVWRLPVSPAAVPARAKNGFRTLITNPNWPLFLGVVFVGGVGVSILSNYLFLYLKDMGTNETVMGLTLTVATLSELPVFFFSNRLLRRWGTRGLLLLSLSILGFRLIAYAFVHTPWLVLALQLLHGVSFSTWWVAGVSQAAKLAPPELGATAQGLFSGAMFGMGGAAGGLLGGLLYESLGAWGMFLWAGVGVLASLVGYTSIERWIRGNA